MQFHFPSFVDFPEFLYYIVCVCNFIFFLNDIFVHYFMRTSFFPISVLRNVLWVERGDAQANGDLQAIGCHYTTSFAIFICRGNNFKNCNIIILFYFDYIHYPVHLLLYDFIFYSIKRKLQWQLTGLNKLQWRN